jgi:ppGpp synthetase/RelA/SpoT-type nucleotidyltranferase
VNTSVSAINDREVREMLYISDFSYSKSQVDNAGKTLSQENPPPEKWESSMQILSSWRAHHASPLDTITKQVSSKAKAIDQQAIVAKRLKRLSSIIKKLNFLKKSRLSAMQDIGGCRAILSNKDQVDKLTDTLLLDNRYKLRDDYIKTPKPNGYRSVHIINKSEHPYGNPAVPIEIQLRTAIQHSWATAVEIIDLFTNQDLKSAARGQKDWKRFFDLASKEMAALDGYQKHENGNIIKLDNLMKKLNILNKFQLYSSTAKHIENFKKNETNGIYLFKINSKISSIEISEFYDADFQSAKLAYLNEEKKNSKKSYMTISLVSTDKFENLKKAYPNYFADSRKFIENLQEILKQKQEKDNKSNWFIDMIMTHRNPKG